MSPPKKRPDTSERALLLRDEARQAGGDLWVSAASRPLERLLDLTALTDLLTPLGRA